MTSCLKVGGYALESDKYHQCELPKLSYRALGMRKQFENTLRTHEGNKKLVEILVEDSSNKTKRFI
jgi:hypothetical protein